MAIWYNLLKATQLERGHRTSSEAYSWVVSILGCCMDTDTNMHTYVHICKYTHTHTYTNKHAHSHSEQTHTCSIMHLCSSTSTHPHAQIHPQAQVCTSARTHTHTRIIWVHKRGYMYYHKYSHTAFHWLGRIFLNYCNLSIFQISNIMNIIAKISFFLLPFLQPSFFCPSLLFRLCLPILWPDLCSCFFFLALES